MVGPAGIEPVGFRHDTEHHDQNEESHRWEHPKSGRYWCRRPRRTVLRNHVWKLIHCFRRFSLPSRQSAASRSAPRRQSLFSQPSVTFWTHGARARLAAVPEVPYCHRPGDRRHPRLPSPSVRMDRVARERRGALGGLLRQVRFQRRSTRPVSVPSQLVEIG